MFGVYILRLFQKTLINSTTSLTNLGNFWALNACDLLHRAALQLIIPLSAYKDFKAWNPNEEIYVSLATNIDAGFQLNCADGGCITLQGY
jgi:hypothetical protein